VYHLLLSTAGTLAYLCRIYHHDDRRLVTLRAAVIIVTCISKRCFTDTAIAHRHARIAFCGSLFSRRAAAHRICVSRRRVWASSRAACLMLYRVASRVPSCTLERRSWRHALAVHRRAPLASCQPLAKRMQIVRLFIICLVTASCVVALAAVIANRTLRMLPSAPHAA